VSPLRGEKPQNQPLSEVKYRSIALREMPPVTILTLTDQSTTAFFVIGSLY